MIHVSMENMRPRVIVIPPISEQRRIVKAIERWNSIISALESDSRSINNSVSAAKNRVLDLAIHGKLVPQDPSDEPAIELLKRLKPAFTPSHNLHYDAIPKGWVLCPLGMVTNYGQCVSVPTDLIHDSDWVLELEDIEKGTGKLLQRISKKDRAINGVRHRFIKGQVLYSKLRTYLNKVLVANEDGYCTTEIVPISPSQGLLSPYLAIVLRSPYFLAYTAECGYGMKMPRLGTNDARKALIPIPPPQEQQRIVSTVETLFMQLDSLSDIIK